MKFIFLIVGVLLVVATVFLLWSSTADATSWRYDEHGRNIDIDICIKCDSPIPGPPGPPGPSGPQGAKGDTGPPGPDKELQVRTVISEPREIPPGFAIVTAHCAADEMATGGGLIVGDSGNLENPTYGGFGAPFDQPDRWVVEYFHHGPDPVLVSAVAECTKLVDVP